MGKYVLYILVILVILWYAEELEHFESECDDLFSLFQQRNLDSLISAVSSSLDMLKKRISTSSSVRTLQDIKPAPCFSADIILSLPNIVSSLFSLSPSL